jgi:hypothetical protein
MPTEVKRAAAERWYVLPIALVTLRVTQAPHAEREEYVFKTYHYQPQVRMDRPGAGCYDVLAVSLLADVFPSARISSFLPLPP